MNLPNHERSISWVPMITIGFFAITPKETAVDACVNTAEESVTSEAVGRSTTTAVVYRPRSASTEERGWGATITRSPVTAVKCPKNRFNAG